ncbi:hypothetical protein E9232_005487 [Inquilinus ginsengisoli]|uniref:Uncharacterized protein n=1 Tax=Inquilinus ginsengisoli TaxID=363840 RepID=A0ABU1JWD3_9PROT|nr:hypothetical protein [Inquilinus ginsengisoli]MDR6292942.1 hypothetical protein [Inquilinus ginsengisoli]
MSSGTRIVIGGPYNSGILATGAVQGATFNTRLAPKPVLQRVRRIEAVCAGMAWRCRLRPCSSPLDIRQWSASSRGGRSVGEFQQNLGSLQQKIPAALWADLKAEGLIEAASPVPREV